MVSRLVTEGSLTERAERKNTRKKKRACFWRGGIRVVERGSCVRCLERSR